MSIRYQFECEIKSIFLLTISVILPQPITSLYCILSVPLLVGWLLCNICYVVIINVINVIKMLLNS